MQRKSDIYFIFNLFKILNNHLEQLTNCKEIVKKWYDVENMQIKAMLRIILIEFEATISRLI